MKSAGVPDSSYPSRTTVTRDWFNQRGLYRARGSYTPKAGDYVVFGNVAHCGIVESVSGGYVTTIEGNANPELGHKTVTFKKKPATTTEQPTTEKKTEVTTQEPTTEKKTKATTQEPITEVATEELTTGNKSKMEPIESAPDNIGTITGRENASAENGIIMTDWECDDEPDVETPVIRKFCNNKKELISIKIKKPGDVDGYEYVVAKVNNKTYKKFKKAALSAADSGISFKGSKTFTSKSTAVKLSGLKKNKKYAVAVRAYKVVDGIKYYSDYSSVKSIKIKK